jgi:hypothetical protein
MYEDITLPEELPDNYGLGVVVIRNPKTRGRFAKTQHVLLDDAGVLEVIRCLKRSRRPGERIFCTYAVMYASSRRVLSILGLAHYSLGGLRAGGATQHWLTAFRLDVLRRRGRWTSERSLEHYIQEAVSAMTQALWDRAIRTALERLSQILPPLLNSALQVFPISSVRRVRQHRGGGRR